MTLTLYLRGNIKDMYVYVNGKRTLFERRSRPQMGEPSNKVARIETEGEVEISACYIPPLIFKHAFLYALAFWLAGFFGLFSPGYSKVYYSLNYTARAKIEKDETFVLEVLSPSNPKSAARGVTMYGNVPVEESGCGWVKEPKAKSRRRAYIALTVVFWLVLLAALSATLALTLL